MHAQIHWSFVPYSLYIFFLTSEQKECKHILICLHWLGEWPWCNQLIMYILTYLEGLRKTTLGRQICNTQNTWCENMSSEAKGGIGRLPVLLSILLWEVLKHDSKKLLSWVYVGEDRTYYALIIIYHKPIRRLLLDQRKIPL